MWGLWQPSLPTTWSGSTFVVMSSMQSKVSASAVLGSLHSSVNAFKQSASVVQPSISPRSPEAPGHTVPASSAGLVSEAITPLGVEREGVGTLTQQLHHVDFHSNRRSISFALLNIPPSMNAKT